MGWCTDIYCSGIPFDMVFIIFPVFCVKKFNLESNLFQQAKIVCKCTAGLIVYYFYNKFILMFIIFAAEQIYKKKNKLRLILLFEDFKLNIIKWLQCTQFSFTHREC